MKSDTAPAAARLLPSPRLSIFLLVIWLLLANDISVSTVVFGALLGWLVPLLSYQFWPEQSHPSRPWLLSRYILIVLLDIIRANFTVARLVLDSPRKLRPAFVTYPLDLDNDFAITILASSVTLTPGTVSADVSADRKYLLIHALDMDTEEALVQEIKERYERPLREIFR